MFLCVSTTLYYGSLYNYIGEELLLSVLFCLMLLSASLCNSYINNYMPKKAPCCDVDYWCWKTLYLARIYIYTLRMIPFRTVCVCTAGCTLHSSDLSIPIENGWFQKAVTDDDYWMRRTYIWGLNLGCSCGGIVDRWSAHLEQTKKESTLHNYEPMWERRNWWGSQSEMIDICIKTQESGRFRSFGELKDLSQLQIVWSMAIQWLFRCNRSRKKGLTMY